MTDPMLVLHAIILAVVEGVTEFLPVSSTGHLILVSRLLHLPPTEFLKSFEIAIQLGAIAAIVVLYWKRLVGSRQLWALLLAACIPTFVIGALLYPLIKQVLLASSEVTVAALIIGGVILWFLEARGSHWLLGVHSLEELTVGKATLIGLLQAVSIVPGVSRAGATIVGGLLAGLSRSAAVEFSFLLAIPTMLAATVFDLYQSPGVLTNGGYQLLAVGMIGAFITALLAVKYFVHFVQRHTFVPFALYRIVVGLLFWWLVL